MRICKGNWRNIHFNSIRNYILILIWTKITVQFRCIPPYPPPPHFFVSNSVNGGHKYLQPGIFPGCYCCIRGILSPRNVIFIILFAPSSSSFLSTELELDEELEEELTPSLHPLALSPAPSTSPIILWINPFYPHLFLHHHPYTFPVTIAPPPVLPCLCRYLCWWTSTWRKILGL